LLKLFCTHDINTQRETNRATNSKSSTPYLEQQRTSAPVQTKKTTRLVLMLVTSKSICQLVACTSVHQDMSLLKSELLPAESKYMFAEDSKPVLQVQATKPKPTHYTLYKRWTDLRFRVDWAQFLVIYLHPLNDTYPFIYLHVQLLVSFVFSWDDWVTGYRLSNSFAFF
jgi:hypothetical protein